MAELIPPSGYLGPSGFQLPSVVTGPAVAFPITEDDARATSIGATGPEILYEWWIDPTSLPVTFAIEFTAIVGLSAAGTGTFTVLLGATTPGSTTGGVQFAVIATTNATSEEGKINIGGVLAKPGIACLVQIIGINSNPSTSSARIRGVTLCRI